MIDRAFRSIKNEKRLKETRGLYFEKGSLNEGRFFFPKNNCNNENECTKSAFFLLKKSQMIPTKNNRTNI